MVEVVEVVPKNFSTRHPSWEVRLLSQIVARDAQSVTGRNLRNIKEEYSLDPWAISVGYVKMKDVRKPIPTMDEWRIGLLRQLLHSRTDMDNCGEDIDDITNLIDSLCSS